MSYSTGPEARSVVYHVPLALLAAYRGCSLIVRSASPRELVVRLDARDLDNLAYLQLCELPDEADCLVHWAEDLAIELATDDPAGDLERLYRFAKLLVNHPVRVALPVVPGFENAVRLALSLQFSVRLEIGQPPPQLIEQLTRLLDDYLHRPTIAQPIELFHSLVFALCHQEPINLWAIQEDDPALIRYVDDRGEERLPGKLATADGGAHPESFVARWCETLRTEGADCVGCPFFTSCRGYFKWPRRDYDCVGVKSLFHILQQAADDLKGDLAAMPPTG